MTRLHLLSGPVSTPQVLAPGQWGDAPQLIPVPRAATGARGDAEQSVLHAGGEEAVHDHHVPPVPGGLVIQKAPELCPRGIADGAGEFPFLTILRAVRPSITSVWISRTSRVVSLCRPSLRRSVIPVRGALLLAGTVALCRGEVSAVKAFVPGVGDLPTGRQGQQVVQADVDPHRRIRDRERFHRRVVAPPDDVQRPGHLRELQPAITERERRSGVLRRGARLPLRLEPWVLGALGEEVRERPLQVPQRLLERNRRHLVEEGQFPGLLPDRQHCGGLVAVDPLLPRPRLGTGRERQL